MNRIILCLLAITASAFAAPVQQGSVALNPQAQKIADGITTLTDSKKIAKMVRIFAAQSDNCRNFVASLGSVTTAAQTCAFTQGKKVGDQVKSKAITPENAPQAILDACPDYKAELEPALTAWKSCEQDLSSNSGKFYSDLPQSFQDLITAVTNFQKEIQQNPDMKKDTATMGPKVSAIITQFKNIPEADRAAVGEKLAYTKELLLPSGQYYNDLNQVLDYVAAKANGQQVDDTDLKNKGMALKNYWVQNSDQEMAYFNDQIENYQVPESIVGDGAVNKVAAAAGKFVGRYTPFFNTAQFKNALNAFVEGDDNKAAAAIAA